MFNQQQQQQVLFFLWEIFFIANAIICLDYFKNNSLSNQISIIQIELLQVELYNEHLQMLNILMSIFWKRGWIINMVKSIFHKIVQSFLFVHWVSWP